jgi:hypothetical protein
VKNLVRRSPVWLAVWTALAVAAGGTTSARAEIAYAYAQQTVNAITVTGTGLANGTMTGTSTSASAVINAVGVATNHPTDTPEAFVGAPPPASQNSFVKYSTQGGGPQAGDFSRGDSLISGGASLFNAAGMNTANVAESVLSTAGTGAGLATGVGGWSLGGTFTSTGTSVTVGYNWANDVLDLVSGPADSAQSSFKVTISVKDQHGHEVDATPTELNTALGSPPNGPEITTSGTGSATLSLAGLTAGDVFAITLTGTEMSAAQIAVPEPGPIALASAGGLLALAVGAVRRRARKA